MKLSTNRPQSDKNNGTLSWSNESSTNIPVESGSLEDNTEADNEWVENNMFVSQITEEDPDEENKVGLESPWNIFS